jgi:predicted transposase/invertase (TIGR01784 family)
LDPKSPRDLVEEVVKMDMAIQEAETKYLEVTQDEETLRLYEMREKALHDWVSDVNHAKREGIEEGIEKGIEKGIKEGIEKGRLEDAKNMLRKGLSIDLIYEITGLDTKTIQSL